MVLEPDDPKSCSDEHLMILIRRKNVSAFNELYERYSERLFRYFLRMLGNDQKKSEDFLQDLFMKIIDKPQLFDEKRRFSTWIYSVARNLCKNEYRSASIRKLVTFRGDLDRVAEDPARAQTSDAWDFNHELRRAVKQLKPKHREVFMLRYQEHFSLAEIADVTGCTVGTVKSRLYYALKNLASLLRAFRPAHLRKPGHEA